MKSFCLQRQGNTAEQLAHKFAGSLRQTQLDAETIEVWPLNEEQKLQVTLLRFEEYRGSSESHQGDIRKNIRNKFEMLKVEKCHTPDPKIRSKIKVTEAFDTQIVHGVVRKNPFRHLERWRAGSVDRWRPGEDKHSTSVPKKEGKDPRERKSYPSEA